MSPYFSENIL